MRCTAEHRGETHIAGDTGISGFQVCVPEMHTGRDLEACPPEMGAVQDRRAASSVMRVRARSVEIAVPQEESDSPKKGLVIAPSVLLASCAERMDTPAKTMVEGDGGALFSTVKRDFATSSGMVPLLVEGTLVEGKETAPTYYNTLDRYEHTELVRTEEVVAKRHKSTITILEAKNAGRGQGLALGLLFRWVLAATVCLLVGTTALPTSIGARP